MTVERDLLAAIAAGDEASREVYRDWLEAHEQRERAEFLRLGRALEPGAQARLLELAASPRVDPAWRRLVARFPISGCARGDCPAEWGALAPTTRADVRSCDACGAQVRYAETAGDADELAQRGVPHVVDIVAAPAWIRTDTWQTGDYTALVRALYPEARGPAPIQVQRPLPTLARPLRRHSLSRMFFGWSDGGTKFQTWSGLFAMGPLGFGRISQRPGVVRDLLRDERVELPASTPAPNDFLGGRFVQDLAMLLGEAYDDDHGPDEWRDDRNHYMRSGLLTSEALTAMDTGDRADFVPENAAEWRAIRHALPGTVARATRETFDVTFALASAIGQSRVRFDRVEVKIGRGDYAFAVTRTIAGVMKCAAPMHPVIGRPFEVAGTPQRAPLIQRDDWR